MNNTHFKTLLNRDYLISRPVRVANGQGGWAIAYMPLMTVPGRLRPASSAEREVALQEQRAITHVFYVIEGWGIQRDDTVEGDAVTVRVQGVREPSRADHHVEIDCLEIQKAMKEIGS